MLHTVVFQSHTFDRSICDHGLFDDHGRHVDVLRDLLGDTVGFHAVVFFPVQRVAGRRHVVVQVLSFHVDGSISNHYGRL